MPCMLFKQAIEIWVHAGPDLRSMSVKKAFRRSRKLKVMSDSSQNANVCSRQPQSVHVRVYGLTFGISFLDFRPFSSVPF